MHSARKGRENRRHQAQATTRRLSHGEASSIGLTRNSRNAPRWTFTLADAWNLAAHQAVDVFSVYPGKHGGMAATREIVHVAKAAGIACCVGSNLELGVGTAAMLHVAAAEPGIDSETYPADIIGPLYHEADLLRQPLELGPEVARVPDGPGLGIELDEGQIERFRQT